MDVESCQALRGRLSFASHFRGAGRAGSLLRCSPVGMVDVVDPNVFETANAGFAQVMYE